MERITSWRGKLIMLQKLLAEQASLERFWKFVLAQILAVLGEL